MKFKADILLYTIIILVLFPILAFSNSIRYFNSFGKEVSLVEYKNETKLNEENYRNWKMKSSLEDKLSYEKVDRVSKCIELSGINKFINDFQSNIDTQIAKQKITSENPRLYERIGKIMKDTFDPIVANQNLYEYVKNNVNPKTLDDVILWYETPVAQKIIKAQKRATNSEEEKALIHYLSNFQENKPPPERITLIKELVEEGKVAESTINGLLSLIQGMRSLINMQLPEEKKLSKEKIDNYFSQMKPQLEKIMRQQIILASLFTYRDVSSGDLEQYIEFLTSKGGGDFNQVGMEAIIYTLNQEFAKVEKKIVALP